MCVSERRASEFACARALDERRHQRRLLASSFKIHRLPFYAARAGLACTGGRIDADAATGDGRRARRIACGVRLRAFNGRGASDRTHDERSDEDRRRLGDDDRPPQFPARPVVHVGSKKNSSSAVRRVRPSRSRACRRAASSACPRARRRGAAPVAGCSQAARAAARDDARGREAEGSSWLRGEISVKFDNASGPYELRAHFPAFRDSTHTSRL